MTPTPVSRALLDAAMLERIAAATEPPHDEALCAVARRMRERAEVQEELVTALGHAEVGLANAKSYEALPAPEQQSVTKALEIVRAAITKAGSTNHG